jgi:hypothetical protein
MIEGLLGSLRKFYHITYYPGGFPQLNWVQSISQIVKTEEFVEQPEFIGYLPHLFSTEPIDENLDLLELLEEARCEDLVLEFSLENYTHLSEQTCWSNAIQDLVSRLGDCNSKSNSIKYALKLYGHYQDNYAKNQIFKYSIKALGCNARDPITLLQTLGGAIINNKDIRQKHHSLLTFSPNDPSFIDSLEATQNVQIFQGAKLGRLGKSNWGNLGEKLIKETVKSSGLLSNFDDGSLSFPILPSNVGAFNQPHQIDHTSPEVIVNPDSSNLELQGNFPLSRIFEVQIPKVEHLKPLRHITTFQEVIGFFQVFSPTISGQQNNFSVLSAEEIFMKYQHLITKDTYIVGLDDNENPIISSWAEIPHRLIAGLPGAGKTNFINWIVFQFLYVNPKRKIYIADFGGLDFRYLNKIGLNIEIFSTPEGFQTLMEKIDYEKSERLSLMERYDVSNLKELQKEDVDIDRALWIIDKAADIAALPHKLQHPIENMLKGSAQKGRKYGIHLLYCTQLPTTEVISKQVTDQCEEKTIFRVTSDASLRIIGDAVAGNIPKNAPGRAWLDGSAGKKFVNVPKIIKPEGSTIPISETLWYHFGKHNTLS